MLRVFNMGVGMVLVVGQEELAEVLAELRKNDSPGSIIGSVAKGKHGVVYDVSRSPEGQPDH
jgi:phosphoribosylaminoimidazole (AIR) synthetase